MTAVVRNLKKYIISNKINTIVHCAGFIGGINFSRIYPDKVFSRNLQMTINIFEVSKEETIKKLVFINCMCL